MRTPPAPPRAHARARLDYYYNDQALTPPVRRLWPPVSADATAVAAPKAEVAAGFAYLDGVLADQPHLVGEFSIADIAFMTRLLGVEIPPVRARAQAWRARLASRGSWARTMFPPLPR